MNNELINDFQIQSLDKHGELDVYVFSQKIIEHTMAIIRMSEVRNGPNSLENQLLSKVRNDISGYFGVEEKDVNVIFNENELFREFFHLPKVGDRTYK